MAEEHKEHTEHTHNHHEHAEHTEHSHEHATHESHSHETAPTTSHTHAAPKVAAKKHAKKARKKEAVEHVKHKPESTLRKLKKFKYWPWVIGAGIVAIIIIISLIAKKSGPSSADIPNASQYGTTKVEFYVMSQCPYGTQVEDGFYPVWKEFGNNIDFELNFIASETGDTFQSLHGAPEVAGDIVQLCAQKYGADTLLEFVKCQNSNPSDLVSSIDKCAKAVGIDAAKITACKDGEEGKDLMRESIAKSNAANAQGSPTMYFNGQLYNGARDENSFKRAVCAGLEGHPLCADISACTVDMECTAEPGKVGICENPGKKDAKCSYQDDAEVKVTVLTSKDCATCKPEELITALGKAFLNMDVTTVDAASTEGKALIKKYSIEKAPGFVFENVENSYVWKNNPNVAPAFKQVDKAYVLRDEVTGANYIIDSAKRAELEAKVGVVKGDNKPQIDFYVMSYCPYGNMAEEAIEPVYQLLKDKADFNPRYVIYSNYQGGGPSYCLDSESKYCSMHGVQELNQDVREICVHKHFGDKAYFEFVLAMNDKCSYNNADTCWEAVAKSVGLDSTKIKACEKDEALTLLAEELDLNKALGVQGSPTVFVEGQAFNGARTPQGYAAALCNGFDTMPAECDDINVLDGTQAAASGSC